MSWFKSKIKMVAARASDALAQAADIVAPTLYESRVDEFHHRWTTVSRFLESVMTRDLDPGEQRRLLLDSHTRDSLQKLVLLIYAEENATDRRELTQGRGAAANIMADFDAQQQQQAPRECLEYLLERQLIPHLCDVGRRDQPCGIMSLAMQFVGALLGRVNHPILPTREVHVSVVALIQAATKKEVDDPVVRKCLINLLNILWKKLRCDPVQTEFFFLHADRHSEVSDLVLFTGLLPHMYAGGKVGEKCREALVIASSVHERALCRFILKLTPFCHYAVNGVISAFDALPKTLPDRLTRHPGASNGGSGGPGAAVAGQRGLDIELQLLATRLRFCCTLAMVGRFELSEEDATSGKASRASISSEVLTQFRARFLDGPLLEGLMHTSEATSRTATLYARIILEELASCCRDTGANPLLRVFLEFLVQQTPGEVSVSRELNFSEAKTQEETEDAGAAGPEDRRLPMELMHRMNSLSSTLSISTMDLFTSLLELQDELVDDSLLGVVSTESGTRPRGYTALSPRSQLNSAIWLASRFPESAVAANAHVWKIQAFDGMASDVEIPVSSANDSDTSEDQIVSLLSYIADAEYVTCQRAPAVLDNWDSSDDENDDDEAMPKTVAGIPAKTDVSPKRSRRDSDGASTSSRTAATRNSMKPLKEVLLTISIPSYSPVSTKGNSRSNANAPAPAHANGSSAAPIFIRLVLNRLERVLESSFYENLALSGLISVLAQKNRCTGVVFDVAEQLGGGHSIRSVLEEVHADAIRRAGRLANSGQRLAEIRRKLVEENNEMSLNDHEPETRLLCGFVVLEEILKELCSILFAKERVKSLPVKPEGYYLEPKRLSGSSQLLASAETGDASGAAGASSGAMSLSIGQEFEQLIADAESTMDSLLLSEKDGVAQSAPVAT